MVDDAVGRGEIDNYINLAKLFRGEGSALFVFCGSGGMDVVARWRAASATSDPVFPRPNNRMFIASNIVTAGSVLKSSTTRARRHMKRRIGKPRRTLADPNPEKMLYAGA